MLIAQNITKKRTGEKNEEGKKSFNSSRRKLLVTSEQVLLSLFLLSVLSLTCLNCNLIPLLIFIFLGVEIKLICTYSRIGEITPAAASRC